MLSKDTIKEKENPTNSKMIKSLSKFSATSPIPNTVAAKSVGIDIKKLNLAESNLEKPRYLVEKK